MRTPTVLGYKLGNWLADLAEKYLPDLEEQFKDQLLEKLITEGRGLRSEDGENPEYDRALVELSMRVMNWDSDVQRGYMEFLILKIPAHD